MSAKINCSIIYDQYKIIELSSQMYSSESINQWQIKSKKLPTGAKPVRRFHPLKALSVPRSKIRIFCAPENEVLMLHKHKSV